jgi:hypothetical protein
MRIGVFDVQIIEGDDVDLALAREGSVADSDVDLLRIRIRNDVDPQVRNEALIHEIIHHVFSQTALPEIVGDHEEIIARSMAPLLATCLEIREQPRRSGTVSR